MRVRCITATKGRHHCIERVLRMFLEQDYEGEHTLFIFNNSDVQQEVDYLDLPKNKMVILLNKSCSSETGAPYTNLGQIYRDALKYIPDETDIVTHMDDDDLYFPNHITEGVKGFRRALAQDKIAYKPSKSYFRSSNAVGLVENTLEPSIFVGALHLKRYKYSDKTTEQHLQWVEPLVKNNRLLVDDGPATLVYNWGDNFPTWKTSGDPNNPENFNNYTRMSQDHGDKLITPLSKDVTDQLFNQIKQHIWTSQSSA